MEGKKRVGFIANEAAGPRGRGDIRRSIEEIFSASSLDWEIVFTRGTGDAFEQASRMARAGIPIVAAIGGDGTVNEVGSALIGTESALGIVPLGSGNGLARHLGIPLSEKDALRLLADPALIEIDYCTANGTPFFCTFGMGFDARVGYEYAKGGRHGFLQYLRHIAVEYFRYRPKTYIFEADGMRFKKKAFLATLANAGQFGYDAYLSPHADIRDGLVDVCILEPFPHHRVPELVLKLLSRNFDRSRFVRILRAKEVSVRRRRAGFVHFDGESARMGKCVRVEVHRKGLRVAVSRSRADAIKKQEEGRA